MGLGNSKDTVPSASNVPNLTTYLKNFPDLLEYRAESGYPMEQVEAMMLRDSKDTAPDDPNSSSLTAFLNKLSKYMAEGDCPKERASVARLGDSEDTIPYVLNISDSLTSTAFLNQPSDSSEYRAEGDCPEHQVTVAMLGDSNPFLGVATSPLLDPNGSRAGWQWSSPPGCQ